MKTKITIFAVLASVLILASCSMAVPNTPGGTDVPNDNGYVTFTDSLNREVKVGKNPEKVACLLGSFAEVWMLSGGTVTATTEDGWDDFDLGLGSDVVNIGGAHTPNLELILSSDPDFVIASSSTASNIEFMDVFERLKIPVAYFDVDNFDDYLSMLDICTDISGRKDLYQKNGEEIADSIKKLKQEVSELNLAAENKKVLILRTSSTSVKAKGSRGTILGEMLDHLGMINIADSEKTLLDNLSVEQVIKEQPYHIFVVTMGNDVEKAENNIKMLIEKNPAWSGLDAVKNGRIHFMDKKLFNIKPNVRWAAAYEILTEIIKEG